MTESDRKADAAAAQRGFGYARPRGRPTLSPGKRKNITSVTMTTDDALYCQTLGNGNISAGVRQCVKMVRDLEARSLAAIKTAAESRDQPPPGTMPNQGMCPDDLEELQRRRTEGASDSFD